MISKQFLYYLAAASVIAFWLWPDSNEYLRLLSLGILLIPAYLYTKEKNSETEKKFDKGINWILFGYILFYFLVYLFIVVAKPVLTLATIFIAFVLLIMTMGFSSLFNLFETNSWPGLLFSYLGVIACFITFFAFCYAVSTDLGWGLLEAIHQEELSSTGDYLYFSAMVSYAAGLRDIIPKGFAKGLAAIQVIISSLFHVVAVGYVVQRFYEQKNN